MKYDLSRFKDRESHTFQIEVVTPLFLGGASPEKAEIRAASIKGMLRFWWRTVWGANFITAEDLYRQESSIWGNTDRQSKVKINIEPVQVKTQKRKLGKGINDNLSYLAYGQRMKIEEPGKSSHSVYREYIEPNSKFRLNLKFKKEKGLCDQVLGSLALLVNYGSLGMRSRNGFGSISCDSIGQYLPENLIFDLKKNKSSAMPFSCFSFFSREFISEKKVDDWESAMRNLGNIYRETKSWSKKQLHMKQLFSKKREAKPLFFSIKKEKDCYRWQCLLMPSDRCPESWGKFFSAMTGKVR